MAIVSVKIAELTKGSPLKILILFSIVTAVLSAYLDNIPFTITMILIVQLMLEATAIPHNVLWWALSLGACLGGNLTMIGASANIVSVGMAKRSKVNISFLEFMRFSFMITLITLLCYEKSRQRNFTSAGAGT